jgi:hypothetical protein
MTKFGQNCEIQDRKFRCGYFVKMRCNKRDLLRKIKNEINNRIRIRHEATQIRQTPENIFACEFAPSRPMNPREQFEVLELRTQRNEEFTSRKVNMKVQAAIKRKEGSKITMLVFGANNVALHPWVD